MAIAQCGQAVILSCGGSFILALLMILYTVLFLVPINNHVAAWNLEELPADWKRDRQTWDKLHQWRVAVLILGFGLLEAV